MYTPKVLIGKIAGRIDNLTKFDPNPNHIVEAMPVYDVKAYFENNVLVIESGGNVVTKIPVEELLDRALANIKAVKNGEMMCACNYCKTMKNGSMPDLDNRAGAWHTKLSHTIGGTMMECPAPSCQTIERATNLVPHLNDHHKWSYLKIADWLDTLTDPIIVGKKN